MLSGALERVRNAAAHSPQGTVVQVSGLIVEIGGLKAAIGDCLRVDAIPGLRLEVVGFKKEHLLTTPLGSTSGLRPGDRATFHSHGGWVRVTNGLLGRVVDSFGQPIDGGEPVGHGPRVPLRGRSTRRFRATPNRHSSRDLSSSHRRLTSSRGRPTRRNFRRKWSGQEHTARHDLPRVERRRERDRLDR